MTQRAAFPRRIDALTEVVAFTTAAFERLDAPLELRRDVDFVLEELFTNVVKYGRGVAPVTIDIAAVAGGVEVTLTEPEAERFDVTRPPTVDTTLPAESRRPGGLGLHLIPRVVDSVKYDYSAAERCSRITFLKTTTSAPPDDAAGHGEKTC